MPAKNPAIGPPVEERRSVLLRSKPVRVSSCFPDSGASDALAGTLNGSPFHTVRDADPRIGPRLEVFAAGQYMWLPFEHIASIRMEGPKRLRDLMWAPAIVRTGPSFRGLELGEILIPVLTPLAWQ